MAKHIDFYEFKKIVLSLPYPISEYGYIYEVKLTDERRSPYWVRRTADYATYIIHEQTKKLVDLESGSIRGEHFDNKKKLFAKYGKWARKIFNHTN